ncbi:MAG TPA: hypothetical protein GX731_02395 [Clostridiales bacterium]|nr:hypothetical protein [Clostridiales bacterium]
MKAMVYKYQISKFNSFVNGLFFAIITMVTLTLCLLFIYHGVDTNYPIYMLFITALFSLIMGFLSMFKKSRKALLS